MCGYDLKPFAQAVLPDYSLSILNQNTCRRSSDVILVGMRGECDTSLLRKPRKIVYLNGEPYVEDLLTNSFYLGPMSSKIHPSVKQFQFFYVQMAALKNGGVSFLALERRPQPLRTKFLMSHVCFLTLLGAS